MTTVEFTKWSKTLAECRDYMRRLDVVDSIEVHQELAKQFRRSVDQMEQDVQTTKQRAELEDRESAKQEILRRVKKYETDIETLKKTSREKLRQSRTRIVEQKKKNREELFSFAGKRKNGDGFAEQYELKQRHNRGEEKTVLRKQEEVTDSMQRFRERLQQELEKSTDYTTTLAESSKTLSATYSEYVDFGSLLDVSKRLIRQLEASDWLDRITLFLAFAFFCLVVLYIIKKRTWDVGISWVAWLSSKGKPLLHVSEAPSTLATFTELAQPTLSLIPTVAASAVSSATVAGVH